MKKLIFIFLFGFLFFNPSLADELDEKIFQAKKICKELGFKDESEKLADCALELISMDNNSETLILPESEKKYKTTININKKLSKRVAEYMTYPDKNLCIGYINNYGVMFKKAKQRARAEAIRIRGLDCSQFRDAAFYDKQRRKLAIADAAKNALNENAESKKRIAESYNKNKSQGERCTYRKVGSYVRKTCY
jgi:hypothetical protein